jgi:hypothetical protein
VTAGVNAGTPIVFEFTQADRIVLRPAAPDEAPTPERSVFRFEWRPDRSARFYRLASAALLNELSAANAADTQDAEGKAFEQKIFRQYLRDGEILRLCLPPNSQLQGSVSIFATLSDSGQLKHALVQPKGGMAECILESTKDMTFEAPPGARAFTAHTEIRLSQ